MYVFCAEAEHQLQQRETAEASESGNDSHNLHVADIAPPGRIQTVEVEVEPKRDSDGGDGSDGDSKEPPFPTDKDGAVEPVTNAEGVERQEQKAAVSIPQPATSQPSLDAAEQPSKQMNSSSIHPPPTHFTSGGSSIAGLVPDTTQQATLSSHLPPLSMTNPDALAQPVMKKKAKPKPVLSRDLLPLHKEVGYSNKQLAEPSTPEFKPTPEWVSCTSFNIVMVEITLSALLQVRSWKQKLPLNTVLRVLQVLVPQVEKLCSEK